jgi:hypothetical protein
MFQLPQWTGHEVAIISPESEAGRDSLCANECFLAPDMFERWASSGTWREMLRFMLELPAAVKLRVRTLPRVMSGGIGVWQSSRRSLLRDSVGRRGAPSAEHIDNESMLADIEKSFWPLCRSDFSIDRVKSSQHHLCRACPTTTRGHVCEAALDN